MSRAESLPDQERQKVMGRPFKMRDELAYDGILTDEHGIEYARLTLNNLLIINELELYFSIMRAATLAGNNKAPITRLNQKFSMTGGWGYDANVDAALRHLMELHLVVLFYEDSANERVTSVQPLATPAKALKVIPPYTTRAETLAGLEPAHE